MKSKIDPTKKYYATFSLFDFEISGDVVELCSQSGDMQNYVRESLSGELRTELEKIDPAKISSVLKGYGAWDEDQLKDNEANLERLLWIACGDISENIYSGEYKD